MLEKIYTIPINEAFDACAADRAKGCPFCALKQRLENDELELILGASMMEPDVRIKTNDQGFCRRHLDEMTRRRNRLGLALMLESHLDELKKDMADPALSGITGGKGKKACERIARLEKSCYVCARAENSLSHMFENAALLWETEREFAAKLKAQPYFCLPHYRRFIEAGRENISKKRFSDFYADLSGVELSYFDELREDVSLFAKKFDYRYENEPWGNAKDAIERAVRFLGDSDGNKDK